ncbi:MAG: efflux RND transporter periplasmic adaptor subunit [Lachnospiraceae bacterium]|nr:efflux RND transporter periplasmic adaptor subunit [Lachnospiraceae bacterium]
MRLKSWTGKKERYRMQRSHIKRVMAMVLIFALSAGCTGCGKREEVPTLLTPVSAQKEYVTVERGRVSSRTYYDAYVTPEIETVWFNYDGVVEECLKVCGDRVEEGEVLAKLRTDELDAEIEAANKELAFLKTDYDYNASLARKQIRMDQVAISMNYEEVTKLDADIAEAKAMLDKRAEELAAGTVSENDAATEEDYEQRLQEYEMQRYYALEGISDYTHEMGRNNAKTEADTGIYGIDVREKTNSLSKLKERKESAVITSPCSGRVLGTVSTTGEQLNSGDNIGALETVYYIADESKAYFTVEGLYDAEFKNDMQVYVIINGKEYPVTKGDYNARLKNEEQDFMEETWGQEKGLPLRFQTENVELMKGMQFGDFYQIVVVERQVEDVLYVPNHAIYRDGNTSYVIRMDGEKEVKTPVDTGMATVCYTEIKDGVQEGDILLSKNVYFDTGNLTETEIVSGNYIAEESFSRMTPASYRNERIVCPVSAARLKEMKVKNGDEVKAGDSIALLELYSNKSSITELNYRLTTIDADYDDAQTALNKQKTSLMGSIYELEAQHDTSGQIGMLQMQIDYLDTLLAQMNARREYEKELVRDSIKRLNEENAHSNVRAGSDGRIGGIAGIKEDRIITGRDTFCIIRDETEQLLRIENNEKLKYNMKVEITGKLGGEEVTLTGRVIAADNVVPPWVYDGEAYNKYAVVKLDEPRNLDGFEGEEAKVEYLMYENAYVVNSNMVFKDNYGSYIYLVRDGQRVRQYVTITEFNNSKACVLDGLWEDETVLSQKEGS